MTEKPQKLDTLKTHEQLAKEEGFSTQQTPVPAETFTPRSYYGAAHQSREKIDEYIGLSEQTLVLKTPRRQGKSRLHAPIP